ncbi:MAG: bZIP transcription factor [Thermonemataceae bacterium]
MKNKVVYTLLSVYLGLLFNLPFGQAQEWSGNPNINDPIHRMGNVGIGLNNPSEKLQVAGNISAQGHISASFSGEVGSGLINSFRDTRWSYGIVSHAGDKDVKALAVMDNTDPAQPTEVFKVMGDGRTFIGTAYPAWQPREALLWVDGLVTAEEVRIKLSENWPDYVFTTDYEMPSLAEVDQFIQANGHLPNTPSAKAIEKEGGFKVGEMTINQQEKIEQVFLHLIEMDKKLQKLATENAALKEEIEQLKK